MKTIYKYVLADTDLQTIHTRGNVPILSAGLDPQGALCVWVYAYTDDLTCPRQIVIVGTGRPVPDGCEFIGTVTMAPFVWHVFEQVA